MANKKSTQLTKAQLFYLQQCYLQPTKAVSLGDYAPALKLESLGFIHRESTSSIGRISWKVTDSGKAYLESLLPNKT